MKQALNNNLHLMTVSSHSVTEKSGSLPRGLLSWAFSRLKTDQNSKEDGSLQPRLCCQDVTQAH